MIKIAESLETAQLLLDAARHSSDLRRSVSTAYYALFYALGQECARLVFGASPASLKRRQVLMRALAHEEMRQACRPFVAQRLPDMLAAARPTGPIDARVVEVATAFMELYQARVGADYAHNATITHADAADFLRTAREAIDQIPALRRVPDFQIFLMALMHQRKLSGRES